MGLRLEGRNITIAERFAEGEDERVGGPLALENAVDIQGGAAVHTEFRVLAEH